MNDCYEIIVPRAKRFPSKPANPYVSYVDPEEVFDQAVKMLALDSATNTISMLCVSRIQE